MNIQRIDLTTDLLCFRLMGIYDQTLHFFEAGFYSGTTTDLKNCLVVRLYDRDGTSLGYMGQSLHQWAMAHYGAWRMPPAMSTTPFLFNVHRIDQQSQKPLIITSSPWMVMKLFQAGYRQMLALIRLTITDELTSQIERLRTTKIYLFLGGDHGARASGLWIKEHVRKPTHNVFLPDGLSPEQLSETEIKEFLDPYFKTDGE